jgi:hypothetical protein
VIPLVAVLAVSAVKDAVDDIVSKSIMTPIGLKTQHLIVGLYT